ncbi:serine hydrolase [Bacillus massiliigorillae]|uniref:serine hydrolase n=1 Tax=Bacillus massiliigorillae TaxID=1243664 RepID=UPI0003A48025|nr:serine hydrolase [Bacillus massiliigorillae]
MKKKILYIGGVILAVMAIASFVSLYSNRPNGGKILSFIEKHPNQAALSVIYNNKEVTSFNSERKMSLASVVKILVAIEYAEQAAEGKIILDEKVKLSELNRYYLENLDGGAHPAWLESIKEKKLVQDGEIALEEVAKGMVEYSSNANTDYLMDRLGLESINAQIEKLGLTNHEPLTYIDASILIPYEIMNTYENMSKEDKVAKAKKELRNMTPKQYKALALNIHEKMKDDKDGSYKKAVNIESWYDEDFDRLYVDRFVQSTTTDYVTVLNKLNSRSYFTKNVQQNIEAIMETPMESEGNQKAYNHVGMKGGSFASVLNMAIYVEDKENNKTELAVFFNGLESKEFNKLSKHMNDFFVKVVNEPEFRDRVEALKE